MERPHLMQKLNEAPLTGVILVTAPAGYGKTSLLRRWAGQRTGRTVWVTLAPWENDPVRFARALAEAAGFDRLAAGPLSVEAVLRQVPAPCTWVLDDCHVLTDDGTLCNLAAALQRLAPGLQVVLAGRRAPRLPLARLRVQGALLRLRAADLAYGRTEVARLVPPGEVAGVLAATGGWPAAVHLLAEAGAGAGAGGATADQGAFLREEVLEHLSPALRQLVEQSSVLCTLNASLCEAVTGLPDVQPLLEELAEAGLVTANDPVEGEYRLHPLLVRHLGARFARGRLAPVIHERAARWYSARSQPYQAAEHALHSADARLVAELVEANGPELLRRGELVTLGRWLAGVTEEALRNRPRLGLLQAWVLTHTGRLAAADARLRLTPTPDSGARGEAAAIRARLAAMSGDSVGSVRWSRRALSLLAGDALHLRGDLLMNIGYAQSHRNPRAAADAFAAAARLGAEAGDPRTALFAAQYLATVRQGQGRLREANRVLENALREAREQGWRDLPAAGALHVALAHLHYERDDLDLAEKHASTGLALGQLGGEAKIMAGAWLAKARVSAARGDEGGTHEALGRLEQLALYPSTRAWRAQLALRLGDVATAAVWAQDAELQPHDQPTTGRTTEYVTYLQVLRAVGRAAEGIDLAGRFLERARQIGRRENALRFAVQLALLQAAAGRQAEAALTLRPALTEARPEGWIRLFQDEAESLAPILARIEVRGSWPLPGGSAGLAEPLTDREADVLRLLAEGRSNQEIAATLFITVGTAKTHAHRIYQKLGVRSRTQAIAAGQQLGLLRPTSIFR